MVINYFFPGSTSPPICPGTPDKSFTGQNSDTTAGDYDFLYREYSDQGRWASPDPAGLTAVNLKLPQSWNRYAYVLNDPLVITDPQGLYCQWDDGSSDDESIQGGANPNECGSQGGTWVPDPVSNFMNGSPTAVQTCISVGGGPSTCTTSSLGSQVKVDPPSPSPNDFDQTWTWAALLNSGRNFNNWAPRGNPASGKYFLPQEQPPVKTLPNTEVFNGPKIEPTPEQINNSALGS